MENKEKRKTTTLKNLLLYFDKVKKHNSSRGRNAIEEEVDLVDVSDAFSHKVVDMSTTYVQENCIENEVKFISDVEGLVDLTKEYGELRHPNKHKRGIGILEGHFS